MAILWQFLAILLGVQPALGPLNAKQNCHKIAILPPNFQKKLK